MHVIFSAGRKHKMFLILPLFMITLGNFATAQKLHNNLWCGGEVWEVVCAVACELAKVSLPGGCFCNCCKV